MQVVLLIYLLPGSEISRTPIQSVDSAVESLEDSPVGQQRASSVTRRVGIQEQMIKYRSGGNYIN